VSIYLSPIASPPQITPKPITAQVPPNKKFDQCTGATIAAATDSLPAIFVIDTYNAKY
jgi:hypothetical protein